MTKEAQQALLTRQGILDSVRGFIATCPFIDEFAQISVDYLSEQPLSYTIDTVPTDTIVKRYINGDSIRKFVFVFASRHCFGETLENIANSDFYEKMSDWLEEQSGLGNLPDLGIGKTAQSIRAITSGYTVATGARTARYQIQCQLNYYQEGAK